MAQQVSNPAKHHQMRQTHPRKPLGVRLDGSGTATGPPPVREGRRESTQTAATPQKKKRNPFCSRPVISTPRTASSKKTTRVMQATHRSERGSSIPRAPSRVRR